MLRESARHRLRHRAGAVQGDAARSSPGSRWRSAFRAGLFNIGAEGQLYLGAFAAALRGRGARAPARAAAAAARAARGRARPAALWGAIPGVLKARFGAHEVINTIMLNFIAFALVSYLGPLACSSPPRCAPPRSRRRRCCRGSTAGAARCAARPPTSSLLLGARCWRSPCGVLLFRTRLGYELRAVGLNARGRRVRRHRDRARRRSLAMALSGALAGLGGVELRARLQALLRAGLLRRRRLPRHRGGAARPQPSARRGARGAVLRRARPRRAGRSTSACRRSWSRCCRRS